MEAEYTKSSDAIVVAMMMGAAIVAMAMLGCTSTYTMVTPRGDEVVRTEVILDEGLPLVWNQPEFMRTREENYYNAQTGTFLGGVTCEQSYTTLVCKKKQ